MEFTKTTEYALRILSFMAMDETKLYSAKDLYENLQIPFRYLRKMLTTLSKSGLMTSVQGKSGGYRIAKKLSDIYLLDIIRAVGDDHINNTCFFGFENCAFMKKCAMHDKWTLVRENINHILTTTNLAEIKAAGLPVYIPDNNSIFTKNH